jgi:hypothetical protein
VKGVGPGGGDLKGVFFYLGFFFQRVMQFTQTDCLE